MDRDLTGVLEDLDPANVPLRFISHATFMRRGVSHRIVGEDITRLISGHCNYAGSTDHRIFYHYQEMLEEVEAHCAMIKTLVMIRLHYGGHDGK